MRENRQGCWSPVETVQHLTEPTGETSFTFQSQHVGKIVDFPNMFERGEKEFFAPLSRSVFRRTGIFLRVFRCFAGISRKNVVY